MTSLVAEKLNFVTCTYVSSAAESIKLIVVRLIVQQLPAELSGSASQEIVEL